ncbi:MAG: twin-arginine translocase subunit TatC [Planctomycetes bacterium]|nr:twin-arginine translocase subunit TatC [Planctomycetota bacterium]MBL7146812.1 twin-arginine translocase subunit TatC [Phycisphaerae bacterium]
MGKNKKKKKQDPLDSTMSLGDHLEELRARLILALMGLALGAIICLIFGPRILAFIQKPYYDCQPDNKLIVIGVADSFVAYMKISLISGLILTSPWVFYHLWMFVAAGLYPNERRYVQIAVPFSVILFVTGALFFLFLVAPLSLKFFLKFGEWIDVETSWTLQGYVSFITLLMLVFGLGFQTPIAIFILNRTGLVSISALRSSRKYVLLGVFVVAAVATPPDVISQITLAIPLYALFEMGILMSWFAERRKKAKESQD